MDINEFWQLIDQVNLESEGDMDAKCELLKKQLEQLSQDDFFDYIRHFETAFENAYSWSLWGAAYVMNGGCSDDAFMDFRATLISQGKAVYEAALKDSESLVFLDFEDEEDICYEGFQYVHYAIADERSMELPTFDIVSYEEPLGEEWDEDELTELYPQLSAKYPQATYIDEFGADLYKPKSYLYITAIIAVVIICCLIFAGFKGLSIWWVVAIGAAVQTVFRLLKKLYLRLINYAEDEPEEFDGEHHKEDQESSLFAFIPIIAIYLLMLPISALWYGVGAAIKWLLN